MILHSSQARHGHRSAPLGVLAATALVSFGMFSAAPSAHAGTKELNALISKLPPGTTLSGPSGATAAQIADAIRAVYADPQFNKLKRGIVAGEALKNAGSQAQDGGDDIANVLLGIAVPGSKSLDKLVLAKDAVKTAGSGKTANVALVPDFAAVIVDSNTEAFGLANLVKSSKIGAGAVLGGRASELLTDGERQTLAINALQSKKIGGGNLGSVATEISQYVAIEVTGDTAGFADAVSAANVSLAAKIGTGTSAGDPTNAANIFSKLLDDANLPKLKSGVAGFVKTVAAVADIEELEKIGTAVGIRSGGVIKFSVVTGVVGTLAKAIVAKPFASVGGVDIAAGPNGTTNKQDELGELAAYMIAAIFRPANFVKDLSVKKAGPRVLAIIKAAVNPTKAKNVAKVAPALYRTTAADVSGSVALTLANNSQITADTLAAIRAYLLDPKQKQAKAIGGKSFAQDVINALTAGFNKTAANPNDPTRMFEDGNIVANGAVSDAPESDFRPF